MQRLLFESHSEPAAAPAAAGDSGGDPDGLRSFQREDHDSAWRELDKPDVRATLMVKATGLGKTVTGSVFAKTAVERGGRVLWAVTGEELCDQALATLRRITGREVALERAGHRACGTTRIVVGSVPTMKGERLTDWSRGYFTHIVFDECFPAGTLVDGKPIELIRVGDSVLSLDHSTAGVVKRRVTRAMVRPAYALITIRVAGRPVRCTPNHPFFVKGRGYVEADGIRAGDLLAVWRIVRENDEEPASAPTFLLDRVQKKDLIGDHGAYEPPACFSANARQQSHETQQLPGEDGGHFARHWTSPGGARRERDRPIPGRGGNGGGARAELGCSFRGKDGKGGAGAGIADALQAGPRLPADEDRDRGRREQPWNAGAPVAGQEERSILVWSRVDSVARDERGGSAGVAVYNLEVEGTHTYFANGILVHNCHHAVANGPRAIFDHFSEAKILGLTATPQRHDGKATGIVFDTIVPVRGDGGGWHREGRQMHWGITHGYLVPMLGWDEKIDEIDLSKVKTVAGDLQKAGVEEAVLKAAGAIARRWYHFVGEETSPYGKRRSLGFCPGVGSAHLVASTLNQIRPNCARVVDGKTPDDERAAVVKAFARNEFQFLVNCMVFREGFDDPGIRCVMNARPTKSLSLYIQIAGRGGRPLPGIADQPERGQRISGIAASAKPNVLLLHIGTNNVGKHQLISPVSLDGRYDPAEQQRAAAMIREKPDLTLEEALEQARAKIRQEVAERSELAARAAAAAEVRTRGRAYDPFASFGIKDPDGIDLGTHPELATPKDMRWLTANDLPTQGMTHSQVRALQKAHFAREAAGLADFRTLNVLRKKEIHVTNVRREKARALLNAIAANRGFRPPQAEIDAILGGSR